jgi:hypothetical protein
MDCCHPSSSTQVAASFQAGNPNFAQCCANNKRELGCLAQMLLEIIETLNAVHNKEPKTNWLNPIPISIPANFTDAPKLLKLFGALVQFPTRDVADILRKMWLCIEHLCLCWQQTSNPYLIEEINTYFSQIQKAEIETFDVYLQIVEIWQHYSVPIKPFDGRNSSVNYLAEFTKIRNDALRVLDPTRYIAEILGKSSPELDEEVKAILIPFSKNGYDQYVSPKPACKFVALYPDSRLLTLLFSAYIKHDCIEDMIASIISRSRTNHKILLPGNRAYFVYVDFNPHYVTSLFGYELDKNQQVVRKKYNEHIGFKVTLQLAKLETHFTYHIPEILPLRREGPSLSIDKVTLFVLHYRLEELFPTSDEFCSSRFNGTRGTSGMVTGYYSRTIRLYGNYECVPRLPRHYSQEKCLIPLLRASVDAKTSSGYLGLIASLVGGENAEDEDDKEEALIIQARAAQTKSDETD